MYKLYKHTNARLVFDACPGLYIITLKMSRLTQAEVQSQRLQVERADTKSNTVYKKGSFNSTSLQDKTTVSDDFELGGEGEMEPMSSVTFSTSLHIT